MQKKTTDHLSDSTVSVQDVLPRSHKAKDEVQIIGINR